MTAGEISLSILLFMNLIATLFGVWLGYRVMNATNGIKDELVKSTRAEALLQGAKNERAKTSRP